MPKPHQLPIRHIEQLSPDEAKILASFIDHLAEQVLCHEVTDDMGIRNRSKKSFFEQWDQICSKSNVEYPDNNGAYMDNLIRLRLIGHLYQNKSELIPEGGNHYGTWDSHIDATIEQTLYLTPFGRRFISACIA